MSQSREKNHSGNQGASQVTSSHITIKNDPKGLKSYSLQAFFSM